MRCGDAQEYCGAPNRDGSAPTGDSHRSRCNYGLIGMATSRWSTGGNATGLSVTGAPGSVPLPIMGNSTTEPATRRVYRHRQLACDRLGSVYLMMVENCICSPPDGSVALASGLFQSGPIKHFG